MKKTILSLVLAVAAFGVAASVRAGSVSFPAKVFLDEKNYPIDFHCIAGQDRTGSVAYVLEALLGADEDHLMRDWETTAFWNRNVTFAHVERYDKLVEGFKQSFPADTVRERVENYVLSLGFTPEDIEKFRSIMLE